MIMIGFLFTLVSCSSSDSSNARGTQKKQKAPAPISTPKKNSPTPTPENTSEPKDTDLPSEPQEKELPCCTQASNMYFKSLDVHAHLEGIPSSLAPLTTHRASLILDSEHEDLSIYSLKAYTYAHDKKLNFVTRKVNDHTYELESMVFPMPGISDIIFEWIDDEQTSVDQCTCKVEVVQDAS